MYSQYTGYTRCLCLFVAVMVSPLLVQAKDEPPVPLEEIIVRVTPMQSTSGLAKEKIPYNIQSATSDDIEDSQSFGIADFLNKNIGSVTINETQENPLQPDLQFRGYTASPLLGLPQGIAVYQNGVRINEVLGDTINWDLVPQSSIANLNLIGGTNPLYGLNTLGGALTITTKNGFTYPNHSLEVYGGSFGRVMNTVESGANNGTLGYYLTANYFKEGGWRDESSSDAVTLFTSLSYRGSENTSLDLTFNYAGTDLTGNGPLPVDLLNRDRSSVFTFPDNTKNFLMFAEVEGEHRFSEEMQISGNLFYRISDSDYFNGNDSGYEDCMDSGGAAGLLCEEGETVPITDQFGNIILSTNPDGSVRDAINNIDTRNQRGYGANLQATFQHNLFDRDNQLILGSAYTQGFAEFSSRAEVGSLNSNRSTGGVGLFIPSAGTSINTQTRTWSLYFTDTLSVTDKLDLTLSARYNNTGVIISDHGGSTIFSEPAPALNGEHDYERINPAIGITYAFKSGLSAYANYSESSRAPTPIELACSDPDAPCTLPNAFLADPPLNQVITESVELGVRGKIDTTEYHAGFFHSVNSDDIIFISTGGATATEGFFSNIESTLRMGIELGLNGIWKQLDWFANYGYLEANYESPFTAPSPNHPLANANGEIQVRAGDRIPGIPQHSFKIGGNYAFTDKLRLGGNLQYNPGVYLRGDEANLLDKTDAYIVVNLHGTYQVSDSVSLFARIDNFFDAEYETFGLLGDTSGVTFDPPLSNDPRFLSPGTPRAGFVGIKISL